MKYFKYVLLGCIILISACSNWSDMHTYDYEGKKFVLQEKVISGFSTSSRVWRFKLGDLPYVDIDPHNTDWAPPFSDIIFKNISHKYLTDIAFNVGETGSDTNLTNKTFLYFDPKKYTRDEFASYTRFMQVKWPAINEKYGSNDLRDFPIIIGTAYTTNDFPNLTFSGQAKPEGVSKQVDMLIKIRADGRIAMKPKKETSIEQSYGFADQVTMPGNLIYISADPDFVDQISKFKNPEGVSLGEYFKITQRK